MKFAKVMFLHLSVSHSVHGGGGLAPGRGGGASSREGGCLLRGGGVPALGVWEWRPPTAAGGTHPTGMHSCNYNLIVYKKVLV